MLHELVKEPFLGFQKDALRFLTDLSDPENNNKIWFDKNRETYEEHLKQPMRDLIDTLAIEINKIDPDIVVNYKSIFRINRDVRFSQNKTPYKNLYSAAFALDRIKSAEIPHFYFQFDPNEFTFAAGQYSMDSINMKKIRTAISKDFKSYKSIINDKVFINTFKKIQGASLTKLPKGYDGIDKPGSDPQLIDAIKLKQFYVVKTYKNKIILSDKVVDVILENIKAAYDFTKFLSNAIK